MKTLTKIAGIALVFFLAVAFIFGDKGTVEVEQVEQTVIVKDTVAVDSEGEPSSSTVKSNVIVPLKF